MKQRMLVIAMLFSIAAVAHAVSAQAGQTLEVSKGDHFDCAPFPKNPTESPINGGTIVCTASPLTADPFAGGTFVGTIDRHQVRWNRVLNSDGTEWSFDREQTSLAQGRRRPCM